MKELHNYTYAAHLRNLKCEGLIAAGISAAAAIGSSAIQAGVSGRMNRRAGREARRQRKWANEQREAQNEWNLEMWNKQNEKNVEFWNMQNEKNLENWNRENEYNSPEAMRDRAVAAGFSPLSAMGGQVSQAGSIQDAQMLSSSQPEGSGIGSSSLPQFANPVEGLSNNVQFAARQFLDWQDMNNKTKVSNAQVKQMNADTEYKAALALTENQLRQGKFDFLGVQIKVGNADAELKGEQKNAVIQSVVESKQRCDQILQWISESGARISLMDYQRYCASRKIDKEVMLLGQEILLKNQQALDLKLTRPDRRYLMKSQAWLNNAQTTGHDYSNMIAKDYYESGQYKTDRINRGKILEKETNIAHWREKQAAGATHSDFGYSYLRGMQQLHSLTSEVTNLLQGYMFFSVGKSQMSKLMPVSTPNPQQQVPFGGEMYY